MAPKFQPLNEILDKFKNKLTYKELDRKALDISRALSAGNISDDKDYTEWAMVTDDPLVIVNYVKAYVTTHVAKLSSSPFRPEDDTLYELGLNLRLNSVFNDTYCDVLNDGYSFLAIGMDNGKPVVRPVDARYIIFNGESPTLRDSTDILIFQIIPKPLDSDSKYDFKDCPGLSSYIDYDQTTERVKTSYYKKTKEGVTLYIYDEDYEHPQSFPLPNIDRIPVIRFVGERVELNDKRFHYRGIYYQMASVVKALALAGTKIQIRTASSSDANFIVRSDSITNHENSWKNSGSLPIDSIDINGNQVPPIQFVPHDNEFLTNTFNLWKSVIGDILGTTVASGSDAVTREEVIARNEVKDAIANTYLSRVADSIEEVYRCINMLMNGNRNEVIILGGYLDNVKRKKELEALSDIYKLAKDSGLNTQGITIQVLSREDLPSQMKQQLAMSFSSEQFKSQQVQQLEQQISKLKEQISKMSVQNAIAKLQAAQRLERQSDYVQSQERVERLKLAQEQWKAENANKQQMYMEVLKNLLAQGDVTGAQSILVLMEQINSSGSMIADPAINQASDMYAQREQEYTQNKLGENNVALGNAPQSMQNDLLPSDQMHAEQATQQINAVNQDADKLVTPSTNVQY